MWFLILTSGIVLWVASLVKIIHFSPQNSLPSFLQKASAEIEYGYFVGGLAMATDDRSLEKSFRSLRRDSRIEGPSSSKVRIQIYRRDSIQIRPTSIDGGVVEKQNVLLVVAHPDDESMFFSPTINYLTSRGHKVHVLCFSVGNADGLGNIRKEEIYRACAVHGILPQQVKVLDIPELQDGFDKKWDHGLLSNIIEDEIISCGVEMIITFDDHGVSGHCNHQDVHYGVRKFLNVTSKRDVEAWELVSTNIIRKYIGPVDIWLSIALYGSNRSMRCLQNEHPRKSFSAMSQHSSQWVWFRKLFISFSSYTYINTLRRMNR